MEEDGSYMKDSIASCKWILIDFTRDAVSDKKVTDAYETEIKKTGTDEIDYIRRGIDNGILVTFKFRLVEAEWYLEKIVDESN